MQSFHLVPSIGLGQHSSRTAHPTARRRATDAVLLSFSPLPPKRSLFEIVLPTPPALQVPDYQRLSPRPPFPLSPPPVLAPNPRLADEQLRKRDRPPKPAVRRRIPTPPPGLPPQPLLLVRGFRGSATGEADHVSRRCVRLASRGPVSSQEPAEDTDDILELEGDITALSDDSKTCVLWYAAQDFRELYPLEREQQRQDHNQDKEDNKEVGEEEDENMEEDENEEKEEEKGRQARGRPCTNPRTTLGPRRGPGRPRLYARTTPGLRGRSRTTLTRTVPAPVDQPRTNPNTGRLDPDHMKARDPNIQVTTHVPPPLHLDDNICPYYSAYQWDVECLSAGSKKEYWHYGDNGKVPPTTVTSETLS